MFSAALCRGLIEEPWRWGAPGIGRRRFSAALCRGLIEDGQKALHRSISHWFSAALCRGLIEASSLQLILYE